jgi:aspartate aminotransferase-like enzyme
VPEKRYLFTPGPTPVPPEVLAAMAEPMIHHRGADFRKAYGDCLERLKQVCRTDSEVLLYTSSGTGAFEAAVVNLVSPGDRVVAVTAGSFGERWATILERYGADVVRVAYEWGETPQPDDLRGALREAGGATLVTLVHSETSTGVVADVRALAAAAKEEGALSVVDAVSSLGAVPLETDAWGLDVVVSGSQKALMTPPGLGLNAVSAAAYEAAARAGTPRFYFDWEKTRAAQAKIDAAFTPAVSLVLGVNVALGMILDAGLDAAFERHRRLGCACREGIKAMGLELFSPDEDRSAVVTAVNSPVDGKELVRLLRDSYGITIAGGQGKLTGKIFRIGHIGWFDVFDITTALAGVELALTELGADVERGAAVSRALEAYADGARV